MELTAYPSIGLVIAGILLFFAIRLAVGAWAARRVKTTSDYVVAGRRLPIYLTAASIMATWFAAETLMGASATAYQWGLQGVVFDPFGAVLCLGLSGFFFIRIMRRARYLTAIDFFAKRYGKAMALAGAITQVFAYLGWTAAQIVAGGAIVHALLGWPLVVGMLFVAVVVTFYTVLGGMWADTLLDFLQMFLSAGGLLLIFIVVMDHAGGWQAFVDSAGAVNVSDPLTILPIPGEGFLGYQGALGWLYWLAAWAAIGMGSLPAQDLMQRSMSARSEGVAVHGTYIAGILYGVFGILSPLIGIALFRLFPGLNPAETEFILVSAALKFLPPVLAALFVAALTSALMSTSDSSLLAGASILTENVLPYLGLRFGERGQLRLTRVMVAVLALASLLVALYAATIYKLAIFAWTVLLVGQVAPFALGIYWKRANHLGALSGFASGFISWLAAVALLYPTTLEACAGDVEAALWDAAYMGSIPAFLISLTLMVAVSLLTQQVDAPKPLMDIDGNELEAKDRLGILLPWRRTGQRQPVPEEVRVEEGTETYLPS